MVQLLSTSTLTPSGDCRAVIVILPIKSVQHGKCIGKCRPVMLAHAGAGENQVIGALGENRGYDKGYGSESGQD